MVTGSMELKQRWKYLLLALAILIIVYLEMYMYDSSLTNLTDRIKIKQSNLVHVDSNGTSEMLPDADNSNINDCMLTREQCLLYIEDKINVTPELLTFTSEVTVDEVHSRTATKYKVPNIVHFIRFGIGQPFVLYNYVSYLGVHKYIKPHAIFLWADMLPPSDNEWWNRTLKEVANIYLVPTDRPMTVSGQTILKVVHSADVLRLQIIRGM